MLLGTKRAVYEPPPPQPPQPATLPPPPMAPMAAAAPPAPPAAAAPQAAAPPPAAAAAAPGELPVEKLAEFVSRLASKGIVDAREKALLNAMLRAGDSVLLAAYAAAEEEQDAGLLVQLMKGIVGGLTTESGYEGRARHAVKSELLDMIEVGPLKPCARARARAAAAESS